MEELAFYEGGMKKIARWSHLLELLKLGAEGLVKMSKLTEVSVFQKPIESQSVPTCLRVFWEKTYTVIINHSGMKSVDGREHTTVFIRIVVNWWKQLNIKNVDVGVRFNKKLQAVVQDPLDERLNTILQFDEIANERWSRKPLQTVYPRCCSGNTSHIQWYCHFVQISATSLA